MTLTQGIRVYIWLLRASFRFRWNIDRELRLKSSIASVPIVFLCVVLIVLFELGNRETAILLALFFSTMFLLALIWAGPPPERYTRRAKTYLRTDVRQVIRDLKDGSFFYKIFND